MSFKIFPPKIFSPHTGGGGGRSLLAKVTFTYRSGINGNNWRAFAGPGLISGAFVSWRVREIKRALLSPESKTQMP